MAFFILSNPFYLFDIWCDVYVLRCVHTLHPQACTNESNIYCIAKYYWLLLDYFLHFALINSNYHLECIRTHKCKSRPELYVETLMLRISADPIRNVQVTRELEKIQNFLQNITLESRMQCKNMNESARLSSDHLTEHGHYFFYHYYEYL